MDIEFIKNGEKSYETLFSIPRIGEHVILDGVKSKVIDVINQQIGYNTIVVLESL